MMEDGQAGQVAEPTQVAEPQAAPQQIAEPQQTQPDDGYMRVQSDQFKDFPGGYHEAVTMGKSWQQIQASGGMESIAQNNRLLEVYRTQSGNPNATATEMVDALMANDEPEALPDDPSQQPLTPAGLEKMLSEREAKQAEQYASENLRQGRERETQTMGQKLDEMGIKKDDPNRGTYHAMLSQQIDAVIRSNFLPHQDEEMQKALDAPASPEVIAKAADANKAFLANIGLASAGQIATQQQTIPGATLGSQPSGRQGPMKLSDLKTAAAGGDSNAVKMLQQWGDGKIGVDQVTRD